MDKINWTLAVDVVLALLVIWKLLQGRRDGMVRKLGGLAALVGALIVGNFASKTYAGAVSEKWLAPALEKWFTHIRESLGLEDVLENLADVLGNVSLPQFLKINVAEQVTEQMGAASQRVGVAVEEASVVVAQRLAGWLLFLLAAVLAYAVIKLIFDGVLDPVIRKLPIIGTVNALLGAILGAILGAVMAILLLWLAYHLAPALSQPGGPLSPESVEKAYLTKLCFRVFPNLFR